MQRSWWFECGGTADSSHYQNIQKFSYPYKQKYIKRHFINISMNSKLMEIYEQRLENLTQTINSLHEIVGNDSALKIMDSPQLLRYRIDRVNELIRDILNSQKEHIIIHLLNKSQNISNQPHLSAKEMDAIKSKLQFYKKQMKLSKQQIQLLKEQLAVERQTSATYKYQFQHLQKEMRLRDEDFRKNQEQRVFKDVQIKQKHSLLQQQRELVKIWSDKLSQSKDEAKQYQILSQKLAVEVEQTKNKLQDVILKQKIKEEPIRARMERIDSLKKQMAKLFQQLQHNKENISIIRQNIFYIFKQPLQQLRKQCDRLKVQIKKQLFQYLKKGFTTIQKEMQRCLNKTEEIDQQQNQSEELLQKMSKLQAEMGSFIETQIQI